IRLSPAQELFAALAGGVQLARRAESPAGRRCHRAARRRGPQGARPVQLVGLRALVRPDEPRARRPEEYPPDDAAASRRRPEAASRGHRDRGGTVRAGGRPGADPQRDGPERRIHQSRADPDAARRAGAAPRQRGAQPADRHSGAPGEDRDRPGGPTGGVRAAVRVQRAGDAESPARSDQAPDRGHRRAQRRHQRDPAGPGHFARRGESHRRRERNSRGHGVSLPGASFDNKRYWETRLREPYSLAGVGYLRLGRRYNEWMYRIRGDVFDQVVERIAKSEERRGWRVLDVGAGTGFYVDRWMRLGAEVTGLDLTEVAVGELSRCFPAARFVQADIGGPLVQVPLEPGSFDAVSAFDVLFHIVDDAAYARAF